MCGICGMVSLDAAPVDPDAVAGMLRMLLHRGPDGHATFARGPVGLGHARLAILDLEGGRQPMASPDGQLVVSFNGEIFNHVELRQSLARRGHAFATRSDTEVLLRAYAEHGDDCVTHFEGQWAFALWDQRRRRLLLSRDRLGVRPLFYTTTAGALLFASEVKALFACPDVRRALDLFGLKQSFTFWATLPPRTVFAGIHELPPGHCLSVEDGQVRTWAYWRPTFEPMAEKRSEADLADELLSLLTDATRLRLRADVPVAAYLSGGLDSTLTTALAGRVAGAPPATFSVTFDQPDLDESAYQEEARAFLGTQHQAVPCRPADIGACFPNVVWHAERPLPRTAPAPLYLLSRLVRQRGYKVVVTGEGADEVLAGYDIFREAKLRRMWADDPASDRAPSLLRKLYSYQPAFQAQSDAYRRAFFRVRPEDAGNPFFSHLPRWGLSAGLGVFFSPEARSALDDYDPVEEFRARLPADYSRWGALQQAQYLEMACLLPGYILSSQGDRVAMAHAVEGRFPFLDRRVVEFASRLPATLKLHGLREKHLLRRSARGLVPPSVIDRPKQPYRAPDAVSFVGRPEAPLRFDYVEELLSPARLRADGTFHPEAVEKLSRKARAGEIIGVKDNMALVGVLSTQLLCDQLIHHLGQRGLAGA